jgi:hypothetical protein
MAIIAKAGGTFVPCPAGLHHAVCVDVHDLGLIEVTFGGKTETKHKCDVYWESADQNLENDKPYLVRKRYTVSLDPKANLRKDLESWRGRPFTPDELKGFDLEKLIGVNCQLAVQHVDRNGTTYADVTAVVPAPRGVAKLKPSAGYVRKKDRTPETAVANGPLDTMDDEPDDIPF